MKHKIYVIGIGPGAEEMMSIRAVQALEECDVIIGYPVYIQLLGERFQNKRMLSTPMREEVKRCRMCFEEAGRGKTPALICSGDAGVYGLASLMYEIAGEYPDCQVEVIPGIPAANSGAAVLGAPLNHDYCCISLSDLLTPWEVIEKRLRAASQGDFCMALYNPSSHRRKGYLKRACDILLETMPKERACGFAEKIGREGEQTAVCTLEELKNKEVNMFTTVFIGNSGTKIIDGKLVTDRGYSIERQG